MKTLWLVLTGNAKLLPDRVKFVLPVSLTPTLSRKRGERSEGGGAGQTNRFATFVLLGLLLWQPVAQAGFFRRMAALRLSVSPSCLWKRAIPFVSSNKAGHFPIRAMASCLVIVNINYQNAHVVTITNIR